MYVGRSSQKNEAQGNSQKLKLMYHLNRRKERGERMLMEK